MKKLSIVYILLVSLIIMAGCSGSNSNSSSDSKGGKGGGSGGGQPYLDLSSYAKVALTEDQKYSLAYMWHEEKLAKDIYLELNKIHPARQLENIAIKSEVVHIQLVQNLVEWYDINITNLANYEVNYSLEALNAMPVGKFAVPQIQDLYNMLFEIGRESTRSSLEVGCMVEVVDINDLDHFLSTSTGNQALIDTFNILRDGSFAHYWAFDDGLKSMGITEGCCSLGVDYCHPEYPKRK
ncbi:MAG: DUF2202 domain-containing protein [Campylobacterota bacterium]|nr:DUF2202 domain-containing protein [Campylobacterota bacterium]